MLSRYQAVSVPEGVQVLRGWTGRGPSPSALHQRARAMFGRSDFFLAAFAVMCLATTASAQNSYCAYQQGTLQAIMDGASLPFEPGTATDTQVVYSGDTRPTRARVVYLAASRSLAGIDSVYLDRVPAEPLHRLRSLYHTELAFVERTDTLWLPVQDSLIPDLMTEARKGDTVEVFVRRVGAHRVNRRTTWIFLVTEFATPASRASWEDFFRACRRSDSTEQVLAGIRAAYDSGLAAVLAELPPSAKDSGSDVWPLWVLGQFRSTNVAWVRLDGETYRAIAYGNRMPAYLVVVPPGSPALQRMRAFLQLDANSDVLVAQMAPAQVNPIWAGVFLLHQLSLLRDIVSAGAQAERSAMDELRSDLEAADVELIAADLLTHGRFRRALDSTLAKWQPKSGADVANWARQSAPAALLRLPSGSLAVPARSDAEARLRGGVVMTSLLIRYCENAKLPPGDCAILIGQLASPKGQ